MISCDFFFKYQRESKKSNWNIFIIKRPYGKHTFKAAKCLQEGLLFPPLLTNSEIWVYVLEKDVQYLGKCDTMLHRKLLYENENPSRVFVLLELGVVPVKFMLKGKHANLSNNIFNGSGDSMLKMFRRL